MKAINMFNEIGFDVIRDDRDYITYVDIHDSKHYITFDKRFGTVYHCLKYEESSKSDYVIVSHHIKVMKAIMQQIKELEKESRYII